MKVCNKLNVSKAELLKLFPDCDSDIFLRDPVSDQELIERYLPNKLWRLNNLYTIVDKHGVRRPFVMNRSQLRVYAASLKHPRLLILKSRQQGISTFWLISFMDDDIFIDDINAGLMSQGKSESGTLLKRTKLAWNELNGSVKSFLNLSLVKDNSDELGFSNGSTIFIRTSFRSATLQRLHISEYGKICNKYPERAKETKTGTLQAIAPGNTVVIESTAEGINDFKRMWDLAEGRDPSTLGPKEFQGVFLSWLDDPDCVSPVERVPTREQAEYFTKLEKELGRELTVQQKNFWIDQYAELGEETYQEYPATPSEAFQAVRDGAYYDRLYKTHVLKAGRRVAGLYDANLPVEVAIDLGMNDEFVMGYFQIWDGSYRIVEEYHNNGEGIAHYVEHMFNTGYNITNVYLPHDAEVRELTSGMSRRDRFIELGVRNVIVLDKLPITTGIELVRKLIPNLWIDEKCEYLHECMQNYSKEWDPKLEVWKDKPLHNEFSHGADMVRYLAMSRSSGNVTVHSSAQSNKRRRSRAVVDGMAM